MFNIILSNNNKLILVLLMVLEYIMIKAYLVLILFHLWPMLNTNLVKTINYKFYLKIMVGLINVIGCIPFYLILPKLITLYNYKNKIFYSYKMELSFYWMVLCKFKFLIINLVHKFNAPKTLLILISFMVIKIYKCMVILIWIYFLLILVLIMDKISLHYNQH